MSGLFPVILRLPAYLLACLAIELRIRGREQDKNAVFPSRSRQIFVVVTGVKVQHGIIGRPLLELVDLLLCRLEINNHGYLKWIRAATKFSRPKQESLHRCRHFI